MTLNKSDIIKDIKQLQEEPPILAADLEKMQSFIKSTFAKRLKSNDSNRYIIYHFLGFNLVYFIFAFLGVAVSLKSLLAFFFVVALCSAHIWFFQKVNNAQYDDKISFDENDDLELTNWITENYSQEKGFLVLSLSNSYKQGGYFSTYQLNKDIVDFKRKEDEREKLLLKIKSIMNDK